MRSFLRAALLAAALGAGCAEIPPSPAAGQAPHVKKRIEFGVVERIQIFPSAGTRDRYRVTVRLDGGAILETDEAGDGAFRVGDRVRFANGRIHRE